MINKQNLWFITLFSLILVLSVYYLTMKDDTLKTINVNNNTEASEVVVSENDNLVALKVASEEELISKTKELQDILLNATATAEEKNNAYEELQNLNKTEADKETIEKLIKENFKLEAVVNITDNNINVTIGSEKHDATLANNIIRSIQKLFNEDKYITVKFG